MVYIVAISSRGSNKIVEMGKGGVEVPMVVLNTLEEPHKANHLRKDLSRAA